MFYIEKAKFENFVTAAACATVHARQRAECKIRLHNGTLVADFVRQQDGAISVYATDIGRATVDAWAES